MFFMASTHGGMIFASPLSTALVFLPCFENPDNLVIQQASIKEKEKDQSFIQCFQRHSKKDWIRAKNL